MTEIDIRKLWTLNMLPLSQSCHFFPNNHLTDELHLHSWGKGNWSMFPKFHRSTKKKHSSVWRTNEAKKNFENVLNITKQIPISRIWNPIKKNRSQSQSGCGAEGSKDIAKKMVCHDKSINHEMEKTCEKKKWQTRNRCSVIFWMYCSFASKNERFTYVITTITTKIQMNYDDWAPQTTIYIPSKLLWWTSFTACSLLVFYVIQTWLFPSSVSFREEIIRVQDISKRILTITKHTNRL